MLSARRWLCRKRGAAGLQHDVIGKRRVRGNSHASCREQCSSMLRRAAILAAIGAGVYAVATESGRKRLKRAREVFLREVNAGTRPIEAVGTAIAAFVGSQEAIRYRSDAAG
jgi:predicted metal-dependent phosphoesterase TrpH